MKRGLLMAMMLVGMLGSVSAQHDDLYFVPKKKKAKTEVVEESASRSSKEAKSEAQNEPKVMSSGLDMDEDAYNRRGSYLMDDGDAGFVVITEEGDTMWLNTDTLRLARHIDDERWVNGFDGSDEDYEYAMRIVRFRNPRYAIPVSSPLYWDVVYGGALWPSWDWNIYNDGMYAYVFPSSSNWYYWDYMAGYPYGGSWWGGYYNHHWHGWGGYYAHMWCGPWHRPHYYHPNWHHGHYPHVGKPGLGGSRPIIRNERHAMVAGSRRGEQSGVSRGSSVGSRTSSSSGRSGSSSVRVISTRNGAGQSRVTHSSSSRSGNNEVVRRGGTSTSTSRATSTGSSRSSSGASYSRPSSTRSSSSSVSRNGSSSSSSSRSGSSSYSSSSSRSSSSSSRSSSSSYSSGSSSRSSGSSYSGGSSRSSGGSHGGSSRSSGSRR